MIYYLPSLTPKKGDLSMARPKQYSVRLTDDNVTLLKTMLRKRTTNDTVANRCRILLDLDEAHPPVPTHADCAKSHGISMGTVANTVRIYSNGGIESVITLKRSANSDRARRKVDGRAEAVIIAAACEPAPEGHSRWTVRLLEDRMGVLLETPVSREAIRRTLKKTGCAPTSRTTGASPRRRTRTS